MTPEPAPFRSLERAEYVSSERFALEMQVIFGRQWLYLAHRSQLREPGDFVTSSVGGDPVLVTVGAEGQLHAMANVCRHRGSQLTEDPCGRFRGIVCPYHQWSYELDGALRSVPGTVDGAYMSFSEFGLRQYSVCDWNGLVFVNLDPDAEPLGPQLDGLVGVDFAAFDVRRTKVAAIHDLEVKANWKLVAENYNECYHCGANHQDLLRVVDLRQIFEEGAGGLSGAPRLVPGGLNPGLGAKTLSPDGEYVCGKLIYRGDPTAAQAPASIGFGIQPALSYVQFWHDYGIVHTVRPITVDRSRFTTAFFVHEDAEEGADYDTALLTKIWDVTNEEDVELVERNQRGVLSLAYAPGPNSVSREPLLGLFLAAYRDMVSA
jgi:Rieske 2Fe-2S family protein